MQESGVFGGFRAPRSIDEFLGSAKPRDGTRGTRMPERRNGTEIRSHCGTRLKHGCGELPMILPGGERRGDQVRGVIRDRADGEQFREGRFIGPPLQRAHADQQFELLDDLGFIARIDPRLPIAKPQAKRLYHIFDRAGRLIVRNEVFVGPLRFGRGWWLQFEECAQHTGEADADEHAGNESDADDRDQFNHHARSIKHTDAESQAMNAEKEEVHFTAEIA